MFYKQIRAYTGFGIGLDDKDQILLSREAYPSKSNEYFLITGDTRMKLPEGFVPTMLNNVGQIVGYREDKVVIFENDQFLEIGVGKVYDFNNQGALVGSTEINGQTSPCRWDANGLAWVGEAAGVATAINDHGDMIIVETEDFYERPYSEHTPFEVAIPHMRSFCLIGGSKIPLLGLDGEESRVKAMDIDDERRIVGYSLHSSPDVELEFGSPDGIPEYGSAGNRPILWTDFQPKAIPLPSYSAGAKATTLGPNGIILGYSAHGALDFPACTYALFLDEAFWNRGDVSHRLASMTWLNPYVSVICGMNAQGNILIANPSCKDLVLFGENATFEEDYILWLRTLEERDRGSTD